MTVGPFIFAAHVEYHPVLGFAEGQVVERHDRVIAALAGCSEFVGVAEGVSGEVIDADANQLPLRVRDVLGGLRDQRQRGSPGDPPSEPGRELRAEPDTDGSGDVVGGVSGAIAWVHDPFTGRDSLPQLLGLYQFRGGAVDRSGSATVA